VPQAQVVVHVCVPYVLQDCVPFAAHTPWLVQLPSCQVPLALHVWVLVPQLPQATPGFVCPGAHMPWHDPETHVWLTHGAGLPHWPLDPHVSTPLPD
jgi:hypothetical protein